MNSKKIIARGVTILAVVICGVTVVFIGQRKANSNSITPITSEQLNNNNQEQLDKIIQDQIDNSNLSDENKEALQEEVSDLNANLEEVEKNVQDDFLESHPDPTKEDEDFDLEKLKKLREESVKKREEANKQHQQEVAERNNQIEQGYTPNIGEGAPTTPEQKPATTPTTPTTPKPSTPATPTTPTTPTTPSTSGGVIYNGPGVVSGPGESVQHGAGGVVDHGDTGVTFH